MPSFCLVTRLVLLFSVITSMECAIANKPLRNKHAHNVIHKEGKLNQDTTVDVSQDDLTKAVTPFEPLVNSTLPDDIVESANRRRMSLKITIPLHHQPDKTATSIKHPLPKGMHDIMPHEPIHQGVIDQHKVHLDFLTHEGPKLQRRLHHHFTLEDMRQRRKELKERLQARRKKLAHATPHSLLEKNEEILMMPMPTTEKISPKRMEDLKLEEYKKTNSEKSQKHYVLQKEKEFLEEDNRLDNNESSYSKERAEKMDTVKNHPTTEFLLNHLKNPNENRLLTTVPVTPLTGYVDIGTLTSKTEFPGDSNLNFNLSTKQPTIDAETQSQMLLDYLRKKYRFSSKINHQTTTPSIETTTILGRRGKTSHEKLMSHLKYILGEREDNVTSTDSSLQKSQYESTEQTTMTELTATTTSRVDVTSPAVYISQIKKLYSASTYRPEENATGVIEEPGMYQDWRARFRKALKSRLYKLHEDTESEKEMN